MQLDLPASWNRTTVLEYLDELRLNRTSDMNIRIMAVSPDDLKVFSEIAKNVLGKVDLLKQEVNRIISGMLVDVASDTKHIDDVVVSLTIPEFTGTKINVVVIFLLRNHIIFHGMVSEVTLCNTLRCCYND